MVKNQSEIKFTASIYQKEFSGLFSNFDGEIIFNPNDLKASQADIQIDIKSIDSGDAQRDSSMLGEEWFNVADYPVARFKSIEFQEMEEGQYLAIGNLTLAGKTMPISFPFSLDIVPGDQGDRAYVEGKFSLNRLDFDLGGDSWESDDMVGHKAWVNIRLVAENQENSAN